MPNPKPRRGRAPLACHVCECTEERACLPYGCAWVRRRKPALCSACLAFLTNLQDARKLRRVLEALELPALELPALAVASRR
jgi:hypothetical protein